MRVIELENQGYQQSFGTPSADPYLAKTLPRMGRCWRTTTGSDMPARPTTSRRSPGRARPRVRRPAARPGRRFPALLHAADVGISVDSATDVAKDAADVLLLERNPVLFQTGWFVESLATQTGVIFMIRTRRIPFFPQPPQRATDARRARRGHRRRVLPFTPAGPRSGLPAPADLFFIALTGIVACYLILIEIGKYWFYRWYRAPATAVPRRRRRGYRVHRRARFTTIHALRPAHRPDAGQGTPGRQGSKAPAE